MYTYTRRHEPYIMPVMWDPPVSSPGVSP